MKIGTTAGATDILTYRWSAEHRVLFIDDCAIFGLLDKYQLAQSILREADVWHLPTVVAFGDQVIGDLGADFTITPEQVERWLAERKAAG